jgi:hypothetical protein
MITFYARLQPSLQQRRNNVQLGWHCLREAGFSILFHEPESAGSHSPHQYSPTEVGAQTQQADKLSGARRSGQRYSAAGCVVSVF